MAEEWLVIHRTKILKHALKTVRAGTSPKVLGVFRAAALAGSPRRRHRRGTGYFGQAPSM